MPFSAVSVVGTFTRSNGQPANGTVTFSPPAGITDNTGSTLSDTVVTLVGGAVPGGVTVKRLDDIGTVLNTGMRQYRVTTVIDRVSKTYTMSAGQEDSVLDISDRIASPGITVADWEALPAVNGHDFVPADHGFVAWTCDTPLATNSTILASAGVLYGVKLKLPVAATISSIACRVSTAGNTLTNAYIALYDATGTRRAVSADKAAVWNTSGYYENAMTTPYAAAAGTYYVGVVVGTATTLPTFSRGSNSLILNDGTTAATGFRAWASGTGQTAAPSSVTLSGTTALSQNLWFAFK